MFLHQNLLNLPMHELREKEKRHRLNAILIPLELQIKSSFLFFSMSLFSWDDLCSLSNSTFITKQMTYAWDFFNSFDLVVYPLFYVISAGFEMQKSLYYPAKGFLVHQKPTFDYVGIYRQ